MRWSVGDSSWATAPGTFALHVWERFKSKPVGEVTWFINAHRLCLSKITPRESCCGECQHWTRTYTFKYILYMCVCVSLCITAEPMSWSTSRAGCLLQLQQQKLECDIASMQHLQKHHSWDDCDRGWTGGGGWGRGGGGSHVIISLHMFTLQQDVLLHPPLALTPSSPHQHQSQPPELQELTVVKCVLREHRGEIAAAAGLEMYQPKLKLLLWPVALAARGLTC